MKKTIKSILTLIVLLIITIGLAGCGKEKTIKNATEKSVDIAAEMFNNTFKRFEGNINGSDVRNLYITIMASNANKNNPHIDIKGITNMSSISPSNNYNVKMEKNANGYISVITIKEN